MIPTRISRYVIRELLPPTALGLALYTFVLLMNHFFVIAEKSLSKNLGLGLTLELFAVGIPELLVLAIPMAVLLGTLIGMGRLSAEHEWIALQGSGVGPLRLVRPVFAFGLAASLLSFAIYGFVVPRANFTMRNLRGKVLFASHLASDLRARVFYTDLPGTVLYIDDIASSRPDHRLGNVIIARGSGAPDASSELFLARSGDLYPSGDGTGTLILDLFDGTAHVYRSDRAESYRLAGFDFRQMRLELGAHVAGFLQPQQKVIRDFSLGELLREVRASQGALRALDSAPEAERGTVNERFIAQVRARVATIELHQRIALPLASLCFALLAVPLGARRVRSGKGAGFALSFAVILVYWIAFTLARNQAAAGNFPAALGAWSGNLVILPWAAIAIWRMHRMPGREGLLGRLRLRLAGALPARLRERTPRVTPAAPAAPATPRSSVLPAKPPLRLVGRVDRYVAGTFLRTLGLALASAYTIYALVELRALLDSALRTDQPLALVGRYFQYFVPGVLYVVLPISCLVAAVVTIALLGRTGELTAVAASGVSLHRATLPVLALTLGLSVLSFVIQDRIAPVTNRRAEEIKDRIQGRTPRSYGAPVGGRWGLDPDGQRLYHFRLYDPAARRITELTEFTLDRETHRVVRHRFARQATWREDGTWELEDGWSRTFPEGGAGGEFQRFRGTEIVRDLPALGEESSRIERLAALGDVGSEMSASELRSEIENLAARGYDLTRLEVAYHGKWAQPLAPLVMTLLGLPFAFRVGRRGSLYSIGVALVLVLVYWGTFAAFRALGLEAFLDPILAAWTPNVLFSLLGLYLMLWIRT